MEKVISRKNMRRQLMAFKIVRVGNAVFLILRNNLNFLFYGNNLIYYIKLN